MSGHTIGFVPTMGALHAGHISLLELAKTTCSKVVVSIFVNPTQFNNPSDLEKYPRTVNDDIDLLTFSLCDAVFIPDEKVVYPAGFENPVIDLEGLDTMMEGEFREGHFKGVVEVVNRLFGFIQPDFAFFGNKDFQQLSILRFMAKKLNWTTTIVGCDTIRQDNGLARSSRNMRLSGIENEKASMLYRGLLFARELAKTESPKIVKSKLQAFYEENDVKMEYVYIADPENLSELTDNWKKGATVCVAAYFGDVRLIDNLEILEK